MTQTLPLRSVGFWMALSMGLSQAVNVVRVLRDPLGFAASMGLPLDAAADPAFVYVYGLRTTFIALLVTAFALRGNTVALMWMALAALVMPLGDALLTIQAEAAGAQIARHIIIFVYVLITFFMLWRWNRRQRDLNASH